MHIHKAGGALKTAVAALTCTLGVTGSSSMPRTVLNTHLQQQQQQQQQAGCQASTLRQPIPDRFTHVLQKGSVKTARSCANRHALPCKRLSKSVFVAATQQNCPRQQQ
jgi:hypothetical protein